MKEFSDKDLGHLILSKNKRAKNLIAKRKANHYYIVIPESVSYQKALDIIEKMKPKLLSLSYKPEFKITENTVFKTFSFKLLFQKGETDNFYIQLKDNILFIIYPKNTDFNNEQVQTLIKEIVEKALRREAKRILPNKISILAKQFGFQFSQVKITKSKSKWGSCSGKKNINLSYWCLILPEHLIDLIILHELCHTKEMNHSERFWSLLDNVTNNKAKDLTTELKSFSMPW